MSEYSSSNENEYIRAEIFDFPVQIICLEGLDKTLDSLLEVEEKDELSDDEWSVLFISNNNVFNCISKMF